MNRAAHLAHLLRLLDLEAQAEAEQLAARRAPPATEAVKRRVPLTIPTCCEAW